jgi:formate hydrogenlyase subunit 3/multisubunit Na+/H+ antiporter MnhD subunit
MAALVGLPLALGIASVLLGPRLAPRLAFPGVAALAAAAALLCVRVFSAGPQREALGGWRAPLGIELYADGLSALLIATTALVGVLVSLYARAYFRLAGNGGGFWPLWWLLWAAMNALYLSADAFNAYVALELLGLSAVGLLVLGGGTVALAAGLRYLLAALFGSAAYLLGVALLYGAHGTLSLRELAEAMSPGPFAALALALMATGLALKTALFPLHFWLPPAHGSASAPVSALLSGLVVKASFYLLLRLWFDVFGAVAAPAAAQALGALGGIAVLWGALNALRQRKLKMLVAYSTVAQVGYLFLLFPLASGTEPQVAFLAWSGGVIYAVSHACAKAAMFLAAGSIVHAWGEDDIEHLEGTSARLPWSLFAFALAGVTLMGLPPSGGFIGKWLLLRSAFDAGQWWWAVVLLVGGLLTAVYVFRVLRSAFVPPLSARELHPVPRGMQLAALSLALAGTLLGLAAAAPAQLLAIRS